LKKKLAKSILKYINPRIRVKVKAYDKTQSGRDIVKSFTFLVDERNQTLPLMRLKLEKEFLPFIRFAQETELLVKIGEVVVDQDIFPKDRFDIRLNAGPVTLDDEGNLFIAENPLKSKLQYTVMY
jgi:hypothetical protein